LIETDFPTCKNSNEIKLFFFWWSRWKQVVLQPLQLFPRLPIKLASGEAAHERMI
jgi:hypothetical protein